LEIKRVKGFREESRNRGRGRRYGGTRKVGRDGKEGKQRGGVKRLGSQCPEMYLTPPGNPINQGELRLCGFN